MRSSTRFYGETASRLEHRRFRHDDIRYVMEESRQDWYDVSIKTGLILYCYMSIANLQRISSTFKLLPDSTLGRRRRK